MGDLLILLLNTSGDKVSQQIWGLSGLLSIIRLVIVLNCPLSLEIAKEITSTNSGFAMGK